MVPALLAKIGIPVLAEVIAEGLKKVNNPAAQTAARALGELDDVFRAGSIAPADIIEANRHAERMAEMKLREMEAALRETNESLRAEVASDDVYVRRMRPTFGYLMALTWTAQMFGVAYIIVFRTDQAQVVLQAVESLSMIWAVGLSVLGIYVYKRSEDKKL